MIMNKIGYFYHICILLLLKTQVSRSFSINQAVVSQTAKRVENVSNNNDRRSFFTKAIASSFVSIVVTSLPKRTNAEVIQASGTCVSGQGDVCKDLAEGNELIEALQKRSAENREKYRQVCATE